MDVIQFNYLLSRFKSDSSAMDTLFTYYYRRIVAHLCGVYGLDLAHEAAQTFFTELYDKKSFGFVHSPTAWVYKCAENIAKKIIIKDRKELRPREPYQPQDTDSAYEAEIELNDILSGLDDLSRRIVRMLHIEGYNSREVGEILGMKPATVRQKYLRTLKKLQKKYQSVTNGAPCNI